jgi:transposase
VERLIFTTVLHRLMQTGSDRCCNKWRKAYRIEGAEDLDLQHDYRAMAFLGSLLESKGPSAFGGRYVKDLIEERLYHYKRNLFDQVDLVFFDTTSIYFQGEGGEELGVRGFSKDHRPDLNQMVVGAALNQYGRPICCEMWPGNTADVTSLVPIAEKIQSRFTTGSFCVVADRGMISEQTMEQLEQKGLSYILGVRMRNQKIVREEVLSRAGRYAVVEIRHKNTIKVKEVWQDGLRYIICLNEAQARKDEADRQAIISSLREALKASPKSLVGNKGFRKYLKIDKEAVEIDLDKIKEEARFDGKWILQTNTNLTATEVALKYKELWQVEQVFREMKSILNTRPIYHKTDDAIRGHVFCSFLALVLKKELNDRLEKMNLDLEWYDIKQDLDTLQEISLKEEDREYLVRTECKGTCSSVFKAVGVALPPTIRLKLTE